MTRGQPGGVPGPYTGTVKLRGAIAALVAFCILGLVLTPASAQAAATGPIAGASVVGGGRVAIGSLPSTVAINFNGRLCTGSVISPTAILTAAHCAALAPPPATSVRVNSASAYSGGQVIGVAAAFPDPGYSGRIVHDIAVLKLATPTTAPAIPLATASENASLTGIGAPLTAAGFGQSEPTKFRKPKLGSFRAATLFARADCSSYGVFNPYIMVCASGRAFAKATVKFPSGKHISRGVQRASCFGDSGGPLISNTTIGPLLVGITSFGPRYPKRFSWVACGLKGYPAVYTRVSSYLFFIQQHL